MTFYNPFFPPFPRYYNLDSTHNAKNSQCHYLNSTDNVHNSQNHNPNSTNNAQTVDKPSDKLSQYQNTTNSISALKSVNNTKTINKNITEELRSYSKKNNCKNPLNLGFLYNYFNDNDTLIILGLLFILYTQDSKDLPLMLCLLLLLLDD